MDTGLQAALALHLLKFPEAIEAVVADLLPNSLTEYIYNLADHFSGFYTNCQVQYIANIHAEPTDLLSALRL